MLGFNPLSDSPISDISLPVITGTIYATDSNDTAYLTAQLAVSGSIYTTDGNDFTVISGEDRVDGYILATDGQDTAQFVALVTVSGVIDTTDGSDTTTNTTLQSVCWEKDYFTTARPWPAAAPNFSGFVPRFAGESGFTQEPAWPGGRMTFGGPDYAYYGVGAPIVVS